MKKLLFAMPFFLIFLVREVSAHCPLCTIGAAAVAGGAAWYGVSNLAIGLFIGAFAISIGIWFARVVKKRKKFIPFQSALIIILSFLLTVIPLLPIMKDFYPIYLSWFGEYGGLFNRTYLIDLFLVGSLIGGAIVLVTPWISSSITKIRHGKIIPFQGTILTLLLIIIIGVTLELVI